MIGAVASPVMMLAAALSSPGPVRSLLKAQADCPERARRPATLGLAEAQLQPLLRSGVLVREADGCVWVDRAKAKRRQWRIVGRFGLAAAVLAGIALFVLSMGG